MECGSGTEIKFFSRLTKRQHAIIKEHLCNLVFRIPGKMISNLEMKDKIEGDKILKVTPFKKEIRKTIPHKHNHYFEIIYLSEGSGFHSIDLHKYSITPPMIFFVRQEQVHYWELDSEPDGYVIIIKKAFIEKSLDNEIKSLLSKMSKCFIYIKRKIARHNKSLFRKQLSLE